MSNNYSSWSIDKLTKEVRKIKNVISTKQARNKKEALAKIVSVARSSGFELHELVGVENSSNVKKTIPASVPRKSAIKKRGKVAPKYRNPLNEEETWTGRGRQPLWVRGVLERDGSLDSVSING